MHWIRVDSGPALTEVDADLTLATACDASDERGCRATASRDGTDSTALAAARRGGITGCMMMMWGWGVVEVAVDVDGGRWTLPAHISNWSTARDGRREK
jgi:hypothetical protein